MTTDTQEERAQISVAVKIETKRIHVKLEDLEPNPWQPRTVLDAAHTRDVAESIARRGLLQKPLVRPIMGSTASGAVTETGRFQIAHGHYRIEAIRLLMAEGRWPWATVELDTRQMSDKEMALIALEENAKRKDISPLDTYRAWRRDLEIPGLTQQELAEHIGIARPTLSNALRVLALHGNAKPAKRRRSVKAGIQESLP